LPDVCLLAYQRKRDAGANLCKPERLQDIPSCAISFAAWSYRLMASYTGDGKRMAEKSLELGILNDGSGDGYGYGYGSGDGYGYGSGDGYGYGSGYGD